MGVGHYGVFNGSRYRADSSRYRADIQPRIRDFIRKHHGANGVAAAPTKARAK
jgi:poly-beta-hydroxyalkanoate depolymerase